MDGKKGIQKGGPGSVAIAKGIDYKGEIVLIFQLEDSLGQPLAFMDMKKPEAEQLVKHLKEAIKSIW